MEIPSYPKIYNLGNPALVGLFDDSVLVQEKIDGSQFSFLRLSSGLVFRSKGVDIDVTSPGIFRLAVESVLGRSSDLPVDVIFRGEFLAKPKHNVLAYDRVPDGNIIIFDVEDLRGSFFIERLARQLASDIGYEFVPAFYEGTVGGADDIRHFLKEESVLGGQKVEGVVIKPLDYSLHGRDGKVLIGKLVSEEFREVQHSKRESRVPGRDKVDLLFDGYRTPARWNKAIQHLLGDLP